MSLSTPGLAPQFYVTCHVTSGEKSYLLDMDHMECRVGTLEPVIMALVDLTMYPSNQNLFVDAK